MKLNTVMPYWQTATKVSFTTIQPDSGELVREYYDNGQIRIRLIAKSVGDAIIYSDQELQLFERVVDIEDRGGTPVMPGYIWEVKAVLPVINALGFTDGYAYKVFKTAYVQVGA